MIIDLILNRREGDAFNSKQFYKDVINYGEIGREIADAIAAKQETRIKRALSDYVKDQDYNLDIIEYVKSVKWIEPGALIQKF